MPPPTSGHRGCTGPRIPKATSSSWIDTACKTGITGEGSLSLWTFFATSLRLWWAAGSPQAGRTTSDAPCGPQTFACATSRRFHIVDPVAVATHRYKASDNPSYRWLLRQAEREYLCAAEWTARAALADEWCDRLIALARDRQLRCPAPAPAPAPRLTSVINDDDVSSWSSDSTTDDDAASTTTTADDVAHDVTTPSNKNQNADEDDEASDWMSVASLLDLTVLGDDDKRDEEDTEETGGDLGVPDWSPPSAVRPPMMTTEREKEEVITSSPSPPAVLDVFMDLYEGGGGDDEEGGGVVAEILSDEEPPHKLQRVPLEEEDQAASRSHEI